MTYNPRIPSDLQGRILRLEAGYRECIDDNRDTEKHLAILADTYDARPSTDALLGAIPLQAGENVDQIVDEMRRS